MLIMFIEQRAKANNSKGAYRKPEKIIQIFTQEKKSIQCFNNK